MLRSMRSLQTPAPTTRAEHPLTCRTHRPTRQQATRDARARASHGKPKIGRATEEYERSLAQVGRHIGELIDAFPAGTRAGNEELVSLLHSYGVVLRPWARRASAKMIEEVNARDIETWREIAKRMPQGLAQEIKVTDVGAVMARLMAEQTELIASLPVEAAQRVQRLSVTGLIEGEPLARIMRELARSGEVSEGHARVIARTEASRTASNLTQARAEVAGFPTYRWRTRQDKLVRPGHADMEGRVCEWADPPQIDEGGRLMAFHPGTIWNCRCWAEIIIED